ncbi:MAG: RusA family crossover junction endodeoxyribonuclease [Faecalispora sporosphaeroides]|uniref:RusA family crossover junction endodeoxyribonuclease n=1 Tax=Faecalispora sporosphaeroides TaxID=1549 RepID=UPI003992639C
MNTRFISNFVPPAPAAPRRPKSISFEIPGPPQGKARPRVVRARNGMSMTYTPDKTVAYEELVRLRYKAAAQGFRFADDAQLAMQITAFYPVPKSKSKRIKANMLAGAMRPTKKPDCDNVIKIICDALNELAYKDDAQIVVTQMSKYYGEVPKTLVKIMEVHS